jgi:hypothetical protein
MVGRFSREVGAIGAATRAALGDEGGWESAEDMVWAVRREQGMTRWVDSREANAGY